MEIENGVAVFPNGLRLKLTPEQVSKQAVWDAARRFADPEPPKVYNADTGRHEENPDDPAYHAARELAKERRAFAAVKAVIIMGTELDAAPDGLPGPDETNWAKWSAVRDLPEPTTAFDRYDLWLRYYAFGYRMPAASGLMEFSELAKYVAVAAGLTMEGPSAVVATFRDLPERGADQSSDTVAPVLHGSDAGSAAASGSGY